MVLICPYCESELNDKMLEQEDGCCPECGAVVTASTVQYEEDEFEDDEFSSEFDDDEDSDEDEDFNVEGFDDVEDDK